MTTSAERMRKTRANRRKQGIEEVRGIHAKVELHAEIKAEADKIKHRANKRKG